MGAVTWGLHNAIILYASFLWLLLVVGYYGCLGCLEDQRIGLLNLKASINHPNGTALSSWGGDIIVANCCRWERVTCDTKTNRVTQLSLSSIRDQNLGNWSLNASLLLPFHQLQILDLSGNEMTGCGSLPHLRLWFFVFLYIYIYIYFFIFHKLV